MINEHESMAPETNDELSLSELGAVAGGDGNERVLGVREMRELESQIKLAKQDGMTKEQFLAAISQAQQVQEFVKFMWALV